MAPELTSSNLGIKLIKVVLPEPVAPTIAKVSPFLT